MKLRILLTVVFLAATAGYGEAPPVAISQLPKVEIADVPAPASSSMVVQRGANLRSIASAAYGHEEFSGFVGRLNHVAAPGLLRAGVALQTPSLPMAFRDSGLDPRYQPAINVLAKTWYDMGAMISEYERVWDASGKRNGETIEIPPDLRAKLIQCADGIDAALNVLNHPAEGHAVPRKTIGQFAAVSAGLRRYAAGHTGSYDYDVFELQQSNCLGFTNALIWTQEHYK